MSCDFFKLSSILWSHKRICRLFLPPVFNHLQQMEMGMTCYCSIQKSIKNRSQLGRPGNSPYYMTILTSSFLYIWHGLSNILAEEDVSSGREREQDTEWTVYLPTSNGRVQQTITAMADPCSHPITSLLVCCKQWKLGMSEGGNKAMTEYGGKVWQRSVYLIWIKVELSHSLPTFHTLPGICVRWEGGEVHGGCHI